MTALEWVSGVSDRIPKLNRLADRTRLIYWLLDAGAKITKRMDNNREKFPYFPWNSEESQTSTLRQPSETVARGFNLIVASPQRSDGQ